MNWINLAGLLFGLLGSGLGINRFLKQETEVPPAISEKNDPNNSQDLLKQLQQSQLAYHMATEISQFRAGFLARTSHELRSPLNGLIGMQQLILSDLCDGPEEEREFLAQANESALKMVKVLDDILEVSKIEHGTTKLAIQPIQIAQALQDIQILTQMQAKNRNLHLTLLPIEPEIYGLADPRWLRQVLLHLVDGAITQMEEGSITMSAAADAESGYVHIWIDDNRQIADWSEAIHFLQSAPDPNLPLPTPGLNLLLDQTLLVLMQGKLELLPSATAENPTGTRIQCSIPLSPLEG